MILFIDQSTKLKEIQQKFMATYPFLRIRFADRPHKTGEAAENAYWYDENKPVAAVSKKASPGTLRIYPWHRTGDVEAQFESQFGLHAQIFRVEGERQIQTAGTDVFSLNEQNAIGKIHEMDHEGNQWIEREKLL
jgi:hypothetical protein